MGTLVCFHAHPDDEAIQTGGSMARAAAEGHRVVLVVATNGDHGEVPDDLAPGETLVDRRRRESDASAAVLGIHRVAWLDYADSGMTGWDQNDHPESFLQAPLDEAAERLAAILREEAADVLTVYDWHGGYGHPDHIKVHHVGHRAAELAGTPQVFEATMNRDALARMMNLMSDGEQPEFDPEGPSDDGNPFGTPEAEITHRVDVRDFVAQKRASIACHASQVSDSSFFLSMDPQAFEMAFGTEWFIRKGADHPLREGWLFE
ncbi:MAG: PIG-L family deacetylase [Acidimicrobiales bacterium]|nr:PIG-L family deacetylase [Acidimicrobiales bacterium]MCB9394645.1 PIG-L family deacetylase [Acidimicrobiaceae bacterium]